MCKVSSCASNLPPAFTTRDFLNKTVFILALGMAGFAQTELAKAANNEFIEEMIVTASKRSENLQDIPVSVAAFTGDDLENSKINNIDSLVTRVANLQSNGIVGDNTPIFSLRGVSMFDYSLNQSSPVATYYDEVYKGNFALLGVSMYDLERVEVLRGPQGTLYGKNTTGGAVNLISRSAEIGETSGYLDIGYGNYNRVDVQSAVSLPVGDNAAFRLAGTFSRADGWLDNVVPAVDDLAGVREHALRGTLVFDPSDRVRLKFVGSTSYQNSTNYGVYAQPEAVNRAGLSEREIASNVGDKRQARTYSAAFYADVDLSDTLTLTSITSYDDGSLSFVEDTDGQPDEQFEIPYDAEAQQITQDIRLTSTSGGAFDFILGSYFSREKVFNATNLRFFTDVDVNSDGVIDSIDCAQDFFVSCQYKNSFDQTKKNYALYGDAKYDVSERVTMRGGLRYTRDDGRQYNLRADIFGADDVFVASVIPLTELDYDVTNISGRLGLDYRLSEYMMIYVSVSRGYRAPSFNAQAFFDPGEASVSEPEEIWAYESGLKSQWFDQKLTLNAAVFYYDYRDQQLISSDSGVQTLNNIAKSRITGAEVELVAKPWSRLSLRGGIGILSSEIKDGVVDDTDVTGKELPNSPAMTANAGVDVVLYDASAGKVTLSSEISYQSSQYYEIYNVRRLEQGGYSLVSGSMRWEDPEQRYSMTLWVKNLTDKLYFTSRGDLLDGFGFDYNHIGNPRTFGVSLRAEF